MEIPIHETSSENFFPAERVEQHVLIIGVVYGFQRQMVIVFKVCVLMLCWLKKKKKSSMSKLLISLGKYN